MPSKNTKNVVLTDHHMDFVEGLVQSGRYQNASEVMREGLRVLEDRIRRDEAELEEIRHRIGRSLDQLDRGDHADGSVDEIFERTFATSKARHAP